MTCHQIQAYLIHGSQKVMRQLLSKLEEPQQSKEVPRQFYKNFEKIVSKYVINFQWSCERWNAHTKTAVCFSWKQCWVRPGLFWNGDFRHIYEGILSICNVSDSFVRVESESQFHHFWLLIHVYCFVLFLVVNPLINKIVWVYPYPDIV